MVVKKWLKKRMEPYGDKSLEELKKSRSYFSYSAFLFIFIEIMMLILAFFTMWNYIQVFVENIENITQILAIAGVVTICVFFLMIGYHWYYGVMAMHLSNKVDTIELFMYLKKLEGE